MFAPRIISAAPLTRIIMPWFELPSPPALAARQAASVSLPVVSATKRKPMRRGSAATGAPAAGAKDARTS